MVEFISGTFDKSYRPDARFLHTGYLVQLQSGGYPFKANNLSEDEWKWIGWFKRAGERFAIDKSRKR